MLKVLVVSLCLFLFSSRSEAQQGSSHLLSLDLQVPVGVFATSHFAGAGLNYSWSQHRFGNNVLKKTPGFMLNGGADYYFAKKISTAGYPFTYGGYLYLHVMPGLIVNPWQNGNISLNAGPSIGLYKGNADWGLNTTIIGNYFLSDKISIGPGISYKKHAQNYALWSGIVRVSFVF
jgi:hypothetical protein